jgi:DsbC/DsbD-like thiol-disulfide interchange protein
MTWAGHLRSRHPESPRTWVPRKYTGISSGQRGEGSASGFFLRSCRRAAISSVFALGALSAQLTPAQSPLADSPNRSVAHGAPVEYLFPEQVTVPANKPAAVALHFRIAEGFHINSHKPKDEALIPTNFAIPESSGVRLESASYPEGQDFVLPLDPGTKLSVYTGEFTIQAHLTAQRGNHLVEARLRYQACDKAACFPPKTITVPIDVIGN